MGEQLVRIEAPHFCCGVVLAAGHVVETAPIVGYMKGWSQRRLARFCRRSRLADGGSMRRRLKPKKPKGTPVGVRGKWPGASPAAQRKVALTRRAKKMPITLPRVSLEPP